MARGWKEAYEGSRCETCGAFVQRRELEDGGRIVLEAYRAPELAPDRYIIRADLVAVRSDTTGGYHKHTCG